MEVIKLTNMGIRFLLELCIMIILGYWGFKTGGQTLTKVLLGLGSPLLFALVWGVFLAPKSTMRLHEPWLFLVEIILFGLASWALYSTGRANLTVAFASIYVLNKILMLLWKQ